MSKDLTIPEFVHRYRDIYSRAQKLFDKYNPCQVYDGTCYAGRIIPSHRHFCCSGCKYLSETGCVAEALECKLWICYTIAQKAGLLFPSFLTERQDLYQEAMESIPTFGRIREDLLDHLIRYFGKEAYLDYATRNRSASAHSQAAIVASQVL